MTESLTIPEYPIRTEMCRLVGHTLKEWHIRARGVLYVRMLCTRCGCTFEPITTGYGAAPLAA